MHISVAEKSVASTSTNVDFCIALFCYIVQVLVVIRLGSCLHSFVHIN